MMLGIVQITGGEPNTFGLYYVNAGIFLRDDFANQGT
jgi:hypothetical protein